MISYTENGNKVKTVRNPMDCIVCGNPVQFFNSVKGRLLVGFIPIDPITPDTEIRSYPKFMTGRACNGCSHKLDKVIHEQWQE